ncbi:MAG: hypothetical protein Q4E24_15495 [bacterium]|nr:hypothetical protein [bacterium]
MREKYKVTEICELDFGCEGRPEGMEDLVQVRLCSAAGEDIILQVPDAGLYEQDITEGSEVFLMDGKLKKALGNDWIEKCGGKMDAQGFIRQMERLKTGETTVCPFCGGMVLMTAAENGKYKFSCDSCDMYFISECR